MRQALLPLILGAVILLSAACSRGESLGDDGEDLKRTREIAAEIAELRHAGDLDDPDHEVAFDRTKAKLMARGSDVEPEILEALTSSNDPGVRLGAIHILDAIGTRRAVEPLITALADRDPEVSLKAMHTLRVFTEHRIVPETGISPEGLPAVPVSATADPRETEQLWRIWHGEYREGLRQAWAAWWAEHGASITIE